MAGYASFFTGNSPAAPDPAAPARYRLLIVDDEPNVLKALQRVFRQENYEVLTAPDGDEALRLCSATPVDVVISDYMMPKMNGAELLRRFKQTWPDTIRIMLTGHADTGAVMGAVNEGAVYKFILKPWNDDDLRVTVALALEQHDLIRRNRQLQAENSKKSQEIQALSRLAVTNRSQLAIMLHKKGMLNEQQVQELHKLSQLRKEPMLRLLLAREWVSEKAIRAILRKDLLIEEVALAEHTLEPALAELLPRSFCERNWVLPLRLEGKRLTLVMADPMDTGLIDDLRFSAGLEVETVMADSAAIESKILDLYGADSGPSFGDMETLVAMTDPFESIEIVIDEEDDVSLEELLHQTEEMPAVRLVNAIILEAVRLRASDIHIQPRAKSVVVRYRIDGILKDKLHIPHQIFSSLVSRIKIMAELDIAERRRPQDGRITVKTPLRIVDLRLSTLPTISGEKVVMRLLDRNAAISDLGALGFAADDLERVQRLTEKPQGIILATGPTGSGKTNTLYSLLQHNADPGRNYVTIEDPVEFFMDMAGQVHIREADRADLSHRAALHPASGPRCDPAGRDPRFRHRRGGVSCGAHRAPGVFHPAHQFRRGHGGAPVRPRTEALCGGRGAGGHHCPASGAPPVSALPRAGAARSGAEPQAGAAVRRRAPAGGVSCPWLRPLWRLWLSGSHRAVRGAGARRRAASSDDQAGPACWRSTARRGCRECAPCCRMPGRRCVTAAPIWRRSCGCWGRSRNRFDRHATGRMTGRVN